MQSHLIRAACFLAAVSGLAEGSVGTCGLHLFDPFQGTDEHGGAAAGDQESHVHIQSATAQMPIVRSPASGRECSRQGLLFEVVMPCTYVNGALRIHISCPCPADCHPDGPLLQERAQPAQPADGDAQAVLPPVPLRRPGGGHLCSQATLLFLQSSQSLCAFLENARLVLGKLWGRCLHSHRPALLWTDAACAVG